MGVIVEEYVEMNELHTNEDITLFISSESNDILNELRNKNTNY